MKKIIALVMLFSMMLFTVGCANSLQQENSFVKEKIASITGTTTSNKENTTAGELTIEMLDIGQGDAALIRTKDQTIMIDTGDVDQRDKLVQLLKGRGIKTIDKLIITHPHADHIGGAYALFKNFTVKNVYDNGDKANTQTYLTYLKWINEKKIAYHQIKAGDELDFGGGVKFKVFSPTENMLKTSDDLNNNSIVGQLQYNKFTMMFTGDVESKAEGNIVKTYGDQIQSLVLKSPHHGSRTSSSDAFLKALKAKDVLISVGKDNDYGHPHKQALDRYKKNNMKVYRTDEMGTITIKSDGSENYTITTEKNN